MRKDELSREELYEQYITLGKNRYVIAEENGISPERVGTLLQKFGIKRYSVKRHGNSKHPLNRMWCGMKERCGNPNASNYQWYGGKGIRVCDEWMDFNNFFEWAMSNGWEPGLSIDRIDLKGGYSPDNCRFVTVKQQFRNRKSNVYVTVDGLKMLQCEWEEYLGLPNKIISKWKHRHDMEYVVEKLHRLLGENE